MVEDMSSFQIRLHQKDKPRSLHSSVYEMVRNLAHGTLAAREQVSSNVRYSQRPDDGDWPMLREYGQQAITHASSVKMRVLLQLPLAS